MNGTETMSDGESTGETPDRLVRGEQAAPPIRVGDTGAHAGMTD